MEVIETLGPPWKTNYRWREIPVERGGRRRRREVVVLLVLYLARVEEGERERWDWWDCF